MPSDCFINRCADLGLFDHYDRGLDVGCGPHRGALAKYGVDLARGYCRYSYVEEGERFISILTARCDSNHLPFRDNSFYYCVSSHVGEHIPDLKEFIREQMRVAEKWVVFCVPLYTFECDKYHEGGEWEKAAMFPGECYAPHCHFWGMKDYKLDLLLADFPEEAKVTLKENVPHNVGEANIWIDVG